MNDQAGRGDYVTYREHMMAREEAQKRLSAVEMEQATMRAALMHIPDDMRKLTEAVNGLSHKVQTPSSSQHDAANLALHHASAALTKAVDNMGKPSQQTSGPAPGMLPWLLFFGLLGAVLGDASGLLSLVGG